jgi:hypothetical protein
LRVDLQINLICFLIKNDINIASIFKFFVHGQKLLDSKHRAQFLVILG